MGKRKGLVKKGATLTVAAMLMTATLGTSGLMSDAAQQSEGMVNGQRAVTSVPNPGFSPALPGMLEPGNVWAGKQVTDQGDGIFEITLSAYGKEFEAQNTTDETEDKGDKKQKATSSNAAYCPIQGDLVVTDTIGSGFEIVNLPPGASYDNGVLTWRIPAAELMTEEVKSEAPGSDVKRNELVFQVKANAELISGIYETNGSEMKAEFTPYSQDGISNPAYKEGETVTIIFGTTGVLEFLKTQSDAVEITKTVTGTGLTALLLNESFSFKIVLTGKAEEIAKSNPDAYQQIDSSDEFLYIGNYILVKADGTREEKTVENGVVSLKHGESIILPNSLDGIYTITELMTQAQKNKGFSNADIVKEVRTGERASFENSYKYPGGSSSGGSSSGGSSSGGSSSGGSGSPSAGSNAGPGATNNQSEPGADAPGQSTDDSGTAVGNADGPAAVGSGSGNKSRLPKTGDTANQIPWILIGLFGTAMVAWGVSGQLRKKTGDVTE